MSLLWSLAGTRTTWTRNTKSTWRTKAKWTLYVRWRTPLQTGPSFFRKCYQCNKNIGNILYSQSESHNSQELFLQLFQLFHCKIQLLYKTERSTEESITEILQSVWLQVLCCIKWTSCCVKLRSCFVFGFFLCIWSAGRCGRHGRSGHVRRERPVGQMSRNSI